MVLGGDTIHKRPRLCSGTHIFRYILAGLNENCDSPSDAVSHESDNDNDVAWDDYSHNFTDHHHNISGDQLLHSTAVRPHVGSDVDEYGSDSEDNLGDLLPNTIACYPSLGSGVGGQSSEADNDLDDELLQATIPSSDRGNHVHEPLSEADENLDGELLHVATFYSDYGNDLLEHVSETFGDLDAQPLHTTASYSDRSNDSRNYVTITNDDMEGLQQDLDSVDAYCEHWNAAYDADDDDADEQQQDHDIVQANDDAGDSLPDTRDTVRREDKSDHAAGSNFIVHDNRATTWSDLRASTASQLVSTTQPDGVPVFMDPRTYLKVIRCPMESRQSGSKSRRDFIATWKLAINHWIKHHAVKAYTVQGTVSCSTCKLGFLDKTMYTAHLQLEYGPRIDVRIANTHAVALRDQGLLWNSDHTTCIRASSGAINSLSSYSDLLTAHMSSVHGRKDHVIFVFRQSSSVKNFHTAYADKITRIASRAAAALQNSGKMDLASFAVTASISKLRLVPSFSADPSTEMRMVRRDDPR